MFDHALMQTVLIRLIQAWAAKIQTWNTHDAKEGIVDLLNGDKDVDAGSLHISHTSNTCNKAIRE